MANSETKGGTTEQVSDENLLREWLLKNPKPRLRAAGLGDLLRDKERLAKAFLELDTKISKTCKHCIKDLRCYRMGGAKGDFCVVICKACGQALDSVFAQNLEPGTAKLLSTELCGG